MNIALWSRIDAREAAIVERYLQSRPVKVGELAAELGLKVVRAPLPPKISGLIQPDQTAPAHFTVKVNKYELPERQRFTLAHEIAHFLLHKPDIRSGVVDNIMYRSNLTSRKEAEANRLAADIIMPAKSVASELDRLGGRKTDGVVEELAAIFKVSVPAMKVRLGVA